MNEYEIKDMARLLEKKGLLVPVLEPEEAVATVTNALQEYWEDKAAVIWSVEDVLSVAHPAKYDDDGNEIPTPEWMTREQAKDLLAEVISDHDATIGITWDTFDWAVQEAFRKHMDKLEAKYKKQSDENEET